MYYMYNENEVHRRYVRDTGKLARKLLDVLLPSESLHFTEEDVSIQRLTEICRFERYSLNTGEG